MIRNENKNIIGLTFLCLPKFTYTRTLQKHSKLQTLLLHDKKKFISVNEFLSHAEKKL